MKIPNAKEAKENAEENQLSQLERERKAKVKRKNQEDRQAKEIAAFEEPKFLKQVEKAINNAIEHGKLEISIKYTTRNTRAWYIMSGNIEKQLAEKGFHARGIYRGANNSYDVEGYAPPADTWYFDFHVNWEKS